MSCAATTAIAAGSSPDAGSSEAPHAAHLAWVNPARCHPSCAFDPGARLQRLDDRGAPNPRGKLRVDADAAAALTKLLAAAREAGHKIRINSAFRS